MSTDKDQQLGDFIKGRLLFVEATCNENGLDAAKVLETVKAEALRLAGSPERASFLEERVFGGVVLSSAHLPGWVDGVCLEAITIALKGAGSPPLHNLLAAPLRHLRGRTIQCPPTGRHRVQGVLFRKEAGGLAQAHLREYLPSVLRGRSGQPVLGGGDGPRACPRHGGQPRSGQGQPDGLLHGRGLSLRRAGETSGPRTSW